MVIGGVILCIKYIKISDKMARKIELLGYLLLFIVLIWEFIIKNLIMDDFFNGNWYYLDQKLSYIFYMLYANLGYSGIDEQAILEGFTHSIPGVYIQQQIFCVSLIESLLKVFSTVFIAIGRVQELFEKKLPSEKTKE